jgi:hypothetical protein
MVEMSGPSGPSGKREDEVCGASVREREERIAAAYRRGYGENPLTEDENRMLDAAAALAAELPL